MDLKELKNKVNIVDVIRLKGVNLVQHGNRLHGLCPFHNERTPSFVVNESKQFYKCFGCGESGDVISFLQKKYGMTISEVKKELGDVTEDTNYVVPVYTKVKSKWQPIIPIPSGIHPQSFQHLEHNIPNNIYTWRDVNGNVVGYTCRFNTADGKKIVLPFGYMTNGNTSMFQYKSFGRHFYNQNLIHQNPSKTIIVVEGEKCADFGQARTETVVYTTWVGGSNNLYGLDFSIFKGRNIVLWPDNDYSHTYPDGKLKEWKNQPGNAVMIEFAKNIQDVANAIFWVNNPDNVPCGWDIADSDFNNFQLKKYMKDNIIEFSKLDYENKKNTIIEEEPAIEIQSPNQSSIALKIAEPEESSFPFKFLGFKKEGNSMTFCFLPKDSRVVISISAGGISKSNLMTIAPINYWESNFGGKKFNLDAVQEFLIRESINKGMFSVENIRGRGAWHDNGKIVVHNGDHLIVDGVEMKISSFNSNYIYERGFPININTKNPLNKFEAHKVIEITSLLNWERPMNSYLLAGWCVIAPICGSLSWRPHIWLTGSKGTGKTWVFENIIKKLIGEIGVPFEGNTSEAAIRESLLSDAMPVLLDEAESVTSYDKERITNILALARSSSSKTNSAIGKGTGGRGVNKYRINSCFALSSIAIHLKESSDVSRFHILTLLEDKDTNKENWKQLQKKQLEVLTDDYVRFLHARTISLLPTILKNIKTFSSAAAVILNAQRSGDQLGALLAGAYSLTSDSVISFDDAINWIKERDWSEEIAAEGHKDEMRLFQFIMEYIIDVQDSVGKNVKLPIGELILMTTRNNIESNDSMLPNNLINMALNRIGIKVKEDRLLVSNNSLYLKKLLEKTSWSESHSRILLRIEGATKEETMHWGPGVKSRAVSLPMELLGIVKKVEVIEPIVVETKKAEIIQPVIAGVQMSTFDDDPF